MRWTVFNQKGGVGKSTIVCNLAAVSALEGQRTLVVDLDPQGNATRYLLGERASGVEPNLAGLLEQSLGFSLFRKGVDTFVHETPFARLAVLPASPELVEFQPKLEAKYKIYKLREALDQLDGVDAVYLDTPPALNFFTLSALIAADRCLIPFDCDDFSRRALYSLLLDSVREVRDDHNPGLEVGGIVVNQFQARARLPRLLVDQLKAEGLPVLEPFLSASVKVRESHQAAKPLPNLAASHKLTAEFRALFHAIDRGVQGTNSGVAGPSRSQ